MDGQADSVNGGDVESMAMSRAEHHVHTVNRKARRRHALARLIAAGVGLGALARFGTPTAQATNGDPVYAGQIADTTDPTRFRNGVTYATDSTEDGVQGYATGANNAGLFGRNNDTGGIGVAGAAPSGTGVFGESVNGFGVGGKATATSGAGMGVRGEGPAAGVYGTSIGYGVWGVAGQTGAYAGVFSGPVFINGSYTALGAKSAAVPHPDGSHRRLYCMEAPESYFEDVGRGQLANGHAQVQLDPDFAAVVRTDSYEVFLTPRGDCRGLYVTNPTAAGFEVRELQGGTSTLAFSYRIMAHRKDIPGPRFERVTIPVSGGPAATTPPAATATVAPQTPTPTPTLQATPTQTATPSPTALPTRTPTPGPASSPSAT